MPPPSPPVALPMPPTVALEARSGWTAPWAWAGSVAGATLQLAQPVLWTAAAYAALALLALLAVGWCRWLWRARRQSPGHFLQRVALAALAGVLAGFALCGLRASAFTAQALSPTLEGQDLQLTGQVTAMPQVQPGVLRFRFAVEQATLRSQPVTVPPQIELSWYAPRASNAEALDDATAPPADVRPGQRWALTVRLKAPHGFRNPHGPDAELWWWEQGVQALGTVRSGPRDATPRLVDDGAWRHPIERLRQQVRDAILDRLAWHRLDPGVEGATRAAGVVAALVTGDQRSIDQADWALFRDTGVAHLMSISGLHITLFAWLATRLVGGAWRRSARLCLAVPAPQAALVAGLGLAAAYALFSGWAIPAQRTITMLATVTVLRLAGRRWPWPLVWLLACTAVVAIDPWALQQPGFWLSFVAVGVLFATDSGANTADKQGLGARFSQMLREQALITLALAPLGIVLFGQFSLVGLVANLLAIPWVTFWVTPLALMGVVWAPLWDLAAASIEVLAWVLQRMVDCPGAVWQFAAAPAWAAAVAVLGGVLLVLRLPWWLRLWGLPLCLPLLFWQPPRPAWGEFTLIAPELGQGSALLVQTAGHRLLYDAGPRYGPGNDAGQRVLVPLLRALGHGGEGADGSTRRHLDALVLSHGDSDHIGGATAVLALAPKALRWGATAGLPGDTEASRPCVAGQQWEWEGVRFTFLHPSIPVPPTARQDNAHSCVLRVESASGRAALLVGDIAQAQERALVAQGAPLAADVLLVPHHGSRSSSSEGFLEAVRPRWSLVQAGYRNRYGHPAPEVLQRYAERDLTVVESSRCGAATWHSHRPEALLCERNMRRRYWQHNPSP